MLGKELDDMADIRGEQDTYDAKGAAPVFEAKARAMQVFSHLTSISIRVKLMDS